MGMGIYDTGKVSYWSSQKEGFGIIIESVELEMLMRNMYELLWSQAEPVKPGQG